MSCLTDILLFFVTVLLNVGTFHFSVYISITLHQEKNIILFCIFTLKMSLMFEGLC